MRTALLLSAAAGATLGSWIPGSWPADLACLLLIGAAFCVPDLRIPALAAIPAGLSLWAATQAVFDITAYRHATLRSAFWWAAVTAAYAASANLLARHSHRRRALTAFAAFAAAIATYALVQPYATGVNPDAQIGPFLNRNTYACFAELALPVIVWLALRSGPDKWIWWAASIAVIASVIHSGSRAGAAILLIEALVLSFHASVRFRVALLVSFAILTAAFGTTLWTRLQYTDPFVFRSQIYHSALRMIAESPIAGHGMGAFESAYPRFATFDIGRVVNHAHNDWLEFASTGGIPALLAILAFFALNVRGLREHYWAAGIPAVLAHAMVDFPLNRIGVFAWLIILTSALHRATAEETSARHAKHTQTRRRQLIPVEQISPI